MKNKIIKILAKDRAETIKLFRITVYLIALIEIVLKIPNLKLFYGSPDKVIETSVIYGLTYIFNIGYIVDLSQFYLLFCYGYIAVLLLNLSRFQNVITRIMAWYLCGSLNYINPSVGDGGSAVILIFLFFGTLIHLQILIFVCMKIASILKKLDWFNLIDIRYVDGNVNYKQTLNSNSNAYL